MTPFGTPFGTPSGSPYPYPIPHILYPIGRAHPIPLQRAPHLGPHLTPHLGPRLKPLFHLLHPLFIKNSSIIHHLSRPPDMAILGNIPSPHLHPGWRPAIRPHSTPFPLSLGIRYIGPSIHPIWGPSTPPLQRAYPGDALYPISLVPDGTWYVANTPSVITPMSRCSSGVSIWCLEGCQSGRLDGVIGNPDVCIPFWDIIKTSFGPI
jgi:hypothetical protein